MKAELSYHYSELDKEHKFGIVFIDDNRHSEDYVRWVFFYIGKYLGDFKPDIYPFQTGKVINRYKCYGNAKTQAKYIMNAINKKIGRYEKANTNHVVFR